MKVEPRGTGEESSRRLELRQVERNFPKERGKGNNLDL